MKNVPLETFEQVPGEINVVNSHVKMIRFGQKLAKIKVDSTPITLTPVL